MAALYLGIALFGGLHLFSIFFPQARDALESRMGERAWKGAYAVASLIGLVLLVVGYSGSRAGPAVADILYDAPYSFRHITMLLVLIGFVLVSASHGKGYLKLWLRNPMSIGVSLWAAGHLLVNGQRSDVLLFGTFLAVGLADVVMSELRGKRPAHQPRLRSDVVAVIAGMVLYVIFLFGFHPYVLNVPVAG